MYLGQGAITLPPGAATDSIARAAETKRRGDFVDTIGRTAGAILGLFGKGGAPAGPVQPYPTHQPSFMSQHGTKLLIGGGAVALFLILRKR